MFLKEFKITSSAELTAVVTEVLRLIKENQVAGEASVLALHGDLGAGKTTFVQTLARALGVSEVVNSPTFVIMKKYDTLDEQFKQLVHIDAYRIEDIEEMAPLKLAEELQFAQTIIAIEWAEQISMFLPLTTVHLNFQSTKEEERSITMTYGQDK